MSAVPDTAENRRPAWVLPVIVLSQFATTSLWFAGNAILPDLQSTWGLPATAVGTITAAVQIGFVAGTLCFAILSLSDRYPPSTVFLYCALSGAACNLAILAVPAGLAPLLALRFATGFFLAGIYPVGMKIAASWYEEGLGRAIGYLVGALVVGTAFPHLLPGLSTELDWQGVLLAVSAIATVGGFAMYLLVPAGPYLPGRTRFNIGAIPRIFRSRDLRSAAFGYFGHMWELYAFWAFVPIALASYADYVGLKGFNVPLWAFGIIASGAAGCIVGGLVARRTGSAPVAFFQLACSGIACLLSPLLWHAPPAVFLAFFLFWGVTVVGDSPQFSALTAQTAPREYVGTALTIVNSIGFTVTAVSIQTLTLLSTMLDTQFLFLALLPGPVFGLLASRRLL